MKINGSRHEWWVFHTWSRISVNYAVAFGYDPMRNAWGLRLAWGCRYLLGETVREGEKRFADEVNWLVPVGWN